MLYCQLLDNIFCYIFYMFNINLFCNRLKEARRDAHKTQKEIADLLGILQPAYSRFERGIFRMSYEQLFIVCNYIEVSIDYLFGLSDY